MRRRIFSAAAAAYSVSWCVECRESDVFLVEFCGYRRQNMWTPRPPTLARESRHIVRFGPGDTISRCGGQAPEFSHLLICVPDGDAMLPEAREGFCRGRPL